MNYKDEAELYDCTISPFRYQQGNRIKSLGIPPRHYSEMRRFSIDE